MFDLKGYKSRLEEAKERFSYSLEEAAPKFKLSPDQDDAEKAVRNAKSAIENAVFKLGRLQKSDLMSWQETQLKSLKKVLKDL